MSARIHGTKAEDLRAKIGLADGRAVQLVLLSPLSDSEVDLDDVRPLELGKMLIKVLTVSIAS